MKEVIEGVFQQSSSQGSNNQSEIIDIEEVSKLTGYKKATIYKLIHERKIPFHKPAHGGRKVFFKSDEIDKWLQSNRIETNEEFSLNHRGNKEGRHHNKSPSQQKLQSYKSLRNLFGAFCGIIYDYKSQIQELESKLAKYETDGQTTTENLFTNN
ncbi:DNA-binding protein [Paludibacter sp. 221]|nr:DNA-binding protein [Paludibacter sp. 221]